MKSVQSNGAQAKALILQNVRLLNFTCMNSPVDLIVITHGNTVKLVSVMHLQDWCARWHMDIYLVPGFAVTFQSTKWTRNLTYLVYSTNTSALLFTDTQGSMDEK